MELKILVCQLLKGLILGCDGHMTAGELFSGVAKLAEVMLAC